MFSYNNINLTLLERVVNIFISCSSLGFPSLSGSLVVVCADTVGPLQYAIASRSKSDKHVGTISLKL